MTTKEILQKFHEIASNPSAQKEKYRKENKQIVLTAPVYTPEEIIHSMGLVPMGAWGADMELNESKSYFPAFICSIIQSILELGIQGSYQGVSAIVIPSLCDSLKVLGENWKYAVKDIPFIPMTYPQNRKPSYGIEFTKQSYLRMIADLEKATGKVFDEKKLTKSIEIYNEHNKVMRKASDVLAEHPSISPQERSDIFKSGFFMLKEEHTELVQMFLESLKEEENVNAQKVFVTGILTDSPDLLQILEENRMHIVGDDVAAQSRQYRIDADTKIPGLDSLAQKFSSMDHCSVLYDAGKNRVDHIIKEAGKKGAEGIIVILTKFCDPEEFDYPLIKKACEKHDLPVLLIEVDRQTEKFEQARTMMETFQNMLEQRKKGLGV